jgi:predicted nuclease of predicted toxin-antitoxin system
MRLYLDDDSANPVLVKLLRKARHDVVIPRDAGMSGEADPVHLRYAIIETRVMLTRNYDDFLDLHNLILAAQGHHPGILVVREDNDSKRDMRPGDIVRALANLEAAGVPIADSYIILNHWR